MNTSTTPSTQNNDQIHFHFHSRNDRITAIALFILFSFTLITIYQLKVFFSPDPLGPKAFPIIISGLGLIAALFLFFFPDKDKPFLGKRKFIQLIFVEMLLLFYAATFEPLGFVSSTAIITFCVAYQFNIKLIKSVLYAILLSSCSFFLFTKVLELNLPMGTVIEHLFEKTLVNEIEISHIIDSEKMEII